MPARSFTCTHYVAPSAAASKAVKAEWTESRNPNGLRRLGRPWTADDAQRHMSWLRPAPRVPKAEPEPLRALVDTRKALSPFLRERVLVYGKK